MSHNEPPVTYKFLLFLLLVSHNDCGIKSLKPENGITFTQFSILQTPKKTKILSEYIGPL